MAAVDSVQFFSLCLISLWMCIVHAGSPPVESVPVLDCTKLKDGYYKNPINSCSKIYFACSGGHPTGGLPIVQRCGEGDLAYDENRNSCLFRYMVNGCAEYEPGAETRTYPPKPTVSEPVFVCREWGSFAHPDKKCSKAFYICGSDSPYGHVWECPEGTAFDPILKLCLWIDSIPECTGSFRTPAATTVITSSTTDMSDVSTPDNRPPFNCQALGNFPDTVSACSHYFYVCTPDSSIGHLFKCPRFTYFDVVKMKCQFYATVSACSGTVHPSNVTATTIMPSNRTTSSSIVTSSATGMNSTVRSENSTLNCTGKKDGNYRIGKCSRMFVQCAHEVTFPVECPGDLVYRHDVDECVRPHECHRMSAANSTAMNATTLLPLNSTVLNATVSNTTLLVNSTTTISSGAVNTTTTLKSTGSPTSNATTLLLSNTTVALNVTISTNSTTVPMTTTKSG